MPFPLSSIRRSTGSFGRSTASVDARNQAEYPAAENPGLSAPDVERDLPKVQAILDAVAKVFDQMSPF